MKVRYLVYRIVTVNNISGTVELQTLTLFQSEEEAVRYVQSTLDKYHDWELTIIKTYLR